MAIKHTKIIIMGSGPAGTTAAIYCARAMHETLLFSGPYYGGQLTLTSEVENYPGFVEAINGTFLMQHMLEQAKKSGVNIMPQSITNVDLSRNPFLLTSETEEYYSCDALIIATGSKAKWLGLESEEKYRNYGVSTCATCDGFLYKNKEVIIVGGGNTAVEDALYLSNIASKVTIIHRRNYLTAEAMMQERLKNKGNIDIIFSSIVEEILGDTTVNAVKLKNLISQKEKIITIDGVFIAIGHTPQTELFRGQLDMSENNYLKTKDNSTATNIDGVFAAGDVAEMQFKQAIIAAGRGCMAALETDRFLRNNKKA